MQPVTRCWLLHALASGVRGHVAFCLQRRRLDSAGDDNGRGTLYVCCTVEGGRRGGAGDYAAGCVTALARDRRVPLSGVEDIAKWSSNFTVVIAVLQ